MKRRIEAVERRLENIEKTVSGLRKFVMTMSGGEYGSGLGAEERVSDGSHGGVPGEGDSRGAQEVPARGVYYEPSGHGSRTPKDETPGVLHNSLGELFSIKLVCPTFFRCLDIAIPYCTVSFPSSKEWLAKQVREGMHFFIYVTSPVRKVIGLARALGPAEFRGDVTPSRPWVVPMEWVIGPKASGVTFSEAGIAVRSRPGDTVYAIPEDVAKRLVDALIPLPDLDEAEVARLRSRFGVGEGREKAGSLSYSISSNSTSSRG